MFVVSVVVTENRAVVQPDGVVVQHPVVLRSRGWCLPRPACGLVGSRLCVECCWWCHGGMAGGGLPGCVRAALWWCCWQLPWVGAPETPWRRI
jgi:hypothetical protein